MKIKQIKMHISDCLTPIIHDDNSEESWNREHYVVVRDTEVNRKLIKEYMENNGYDFIYSEHDCSCSTQRSYKMNCRKGKIVLHEKISIDC